MTLLLGVYSLTLFLGVSYDAVVRSLITPSLGVYSVMLFVR